MDIKSINNAICRKREKINDRNDILTRNKLLIRDKETKSNNSITENN